MNDASDVTSLELVRDLTHIDKLQPNKVWWKLLIHTNRTDNDNAPERSEERTTQ